MLAIYGEKSIRTTTICVLLLYSVRSLPDDKSHSVSLSGKRSLNNYVATSVPYTVGSHNHQDDSATINEKVDAVLISQDGNSQDMMLDCLNDNHCINNVTVSEASSAEGTFRPYSQDELNKILQKYENDKDHIEGQETSKKVANYYSVASSNNIESSSSATDLQDKSKAWNVVSYSQNYNKNPYDDKMGWVTLEPIPWSSSQVQKWEPNQKPLWPLPPQNNGPWGSSANYQQPSSYGAYPERPYKKPTYQYQAKPWNANQNVGKPPQYSEDNNQGIITDGQPGYFPPERPSSGASYKPWVEHTQSISYVDNSNRPSTHVLYQGIGTGGHAHHIPEKPSVTSSSADGDGHWVLLSSTKGYSAPHRQRSFGRSLDEEKNVRPKEEKSQRPISARRSIRLTVLPSLNGLGTVTSHNGMIERESTHQTVDEAHREHLARNLKFGNSTEKEVIASASSYHGIPAKVEAVSRPAAARNTLLAAVSAGMIPATMAMLLPMLFGRRKRSLEPQIVTLSFKNFPGTVSKYHKKLIPKEK